MAIMVWPSEARQSGIEGIAGGCRDGLMELEVGLQAWAGCPALAVKSAKAFRTACSCRSERWRAASAAASDFHAHPEFEEVEPVLQGRHRPAAGPGVQPLRGRGQRKAAPPPFRLHETFRLQPRQGGPHHGPADAELADQRIFAGQLVAGLDDAVDDAHAKVGGEVRGQVPAHGFKVTCRIPPSRWSRRGPGR